MADEYDFSGISSVDLSVMQHQAREYPEDKGFVKAVLLEIGRREKEKARVVNEARAKESKDGRAS